MESFSLFYIPFGAGYVYAGLFSASQFSGAEYAGFGKVDNLRESFEDFRGTVHVPFVGFDVRHNLIRGYVVYV